MKQNAAPAVRVRGSIVGTQMPIVMSQSAAIPVHDGRLGMVTSRSGKRWVFPKGQIDPGHTPAAAALLEAWEEAGLTGMIEPEPFGSYVYEKLGATHHVLVFRMRVIEVRDDWPERSLRQREWVTVAEAMDRVEEPGLRDLLRRAFNGKQPEQPLRVMR